MAKRLPANGGLSLGDIDVVRCCLEDVQAAENQCETYLRTFSRQGDDDEVQAVFASHADQARMRSERLNLRIVELRERKASATKYSVGHILLSTPKVAPVGHVPEEQIVKNLIAAYSIQKSGCAMYEVLSAVAGAASDESTRGLAHQFHDEQSQAVQQLWRLLPSRSKIAYNVLTMGEIDPSVATKAAENRVR